jgi:transposase
MPTVERGYNRDGDDLAQYNVGIFCDEASKTPLYYNRYNGSLTDKTNLRYVLSNAQAVGIQRVKMVVDGGFWSEECLAGLYSLCDAFTIGMPLYLKEAEKIIAAHGEGIEKYANELKGRQVYCIPVDTELSGVPGRVMLYFDPWNHLNLCNELSNHLNRLGAELAALKRYPKSTLGRYTPYFIITRHENDNGFDYRVDTDKVDRLRKNKGFFLIFSSDTESTPQDVLDHYRAKDAAEKLFAQIKVDMDGSRMRTHTEQTTDGKLFVTFIACVIRSYLLNKLKQYLTDNSTSMKKVFSQLSNITILSAQDGQRFTKALTKKQKQILAAFDAADDIVSSLP